MNRFAVFQGHDAQNPAAQLSHGTPMPYPAVRLNLLLERVGDDPRAPLALDVWTLAPRERIPSAERESPPSRR